MSYTTPFAYFLTWVTYGSRVPGESNAVFRQANGYGEPRIPEHAGLAVTARELMPESAVLLDLLMRRALEAAVTQHCQFREWDLHALNVRTNHVHVVLTSEGEPADRVQCS